MTLKLRINDDMKNAMRAGDSKTRDALRLLLAADEAEGSRRTRRA